MKGPNRNCPRATTQGRIGGRSRWSLGALLAQLFLISAYVSIIASDLSVGTKVWSVAVLLAFSVFYILVPGRCVFSPLRGKIAVIGTLLLLTIPLFAVMGSSAAVLWIFAAVAGGLLFPDWAAMGRVGPGRRDAGGRPGVRRSARLGAGPDPGGDDRVHGRLHRQRPAQRRTAPHPEELARVAVAAERERIGRDLHDILGHSLTAIAVKAGLARRLVGRDDDAAAAEIGEVEKLAREALADVRATASGFREVSLASQLAVTRSVLRAAGIAPNLPADGRRGGPVGARALRLRRPGGRHQRGPARARHDLHHHGRPPEWWR